MTSFTGTISSTGSVTITSAKDGKTIQSDGVKAILDGVQKARPAAYDRLKSGFSAKIEEKGGSFEITFEASNVKSPFKISRTQAAQINPEFAPPPSTTNWGAISALTFAAGLATAYYSPTLGALPVAIGVAGLVRNCMSGSEKKPQPTASVPVTAVLSPKPATPVTTVVPAPVVATAVKTAAVAASANTTDYSALERVIQVLKSGDDVQQKKGALLEQGLKIARNQPNTLTTSRLADLSKYILTPGNTPANLKEVFQPKPSTLTTTPAFYDYQPTASGLDFWVDFANASLGGGCFTHGFVQEEIMVAEMINFANYIAQNQSKTAAGWCDISTRDRTTGSPNPLILKGAQRVQAVDNGRAYGHLIGTITPRELLSSTKPITPQTANILAIAAPHLASKTPQEQFKMETLVDIYNTLAAGFAHVQQEANGRSVVIHSGKIGCGAFNNDQKAVYLLHRLAAAQMGLNLKLHGYSPKEVSENEQAWQTLSPLFTGKTVEQCVGLISSSLLGKPLPVVALPPQSATKATIQAVMKPVSRPTFPSFITQFYKSKAEAKPGEYGNDATAFMSNFHQRPVTMKGHVFQTSEAAYQAGKLWDPKAKQFTNQALLAQLKACKNGDAAFQLAKTFPRRSDWVNESEEDLSLGWMIQVVDAKFNDPVLAQKLSATGTTYLEENSSRDAYWGCGADSKGTNMLGKILMWKRAQLQK